MQNASEFFTISALLVLGGASVGALVVTNALRKVFGWNPVYVCFAISILICFGGAYQIHKLASPLDVLVSFINACLLFCTTTGMQEFGGAATTGVPASTAAPHARKASSATSSWLR